MYLIAGLAGSAGLALFFYRQKIIAQERLKNAANENRILMAMLENRDHLSSPAAVERVLKAFSGRRDETVRADSSPEDDDSGGTDENEPEDS